MKKTLVAAALFATTAFTPAYAAPAHSCSGFVGSSPN
jgi:hypothetical protein